MQTNQQFGAAVRDYLSTVVFAQNTNPEAAGSLTPWQIGLLGALGVLFLLLVVFSVLFAVYRARALRFAAKCEVLEPDLEQTRGELTEATDRADLHERLLEGAGAAIFRLNEEGQCIYVNQAMETLCGFPAKWIGKHGLLKTVHPADREKVSEEWQTFDSLRSPCETSYRLQQRDGRIVHLTGWGSTLRDGQNHVTGYSCVMMDVSDHVLECATIRTAEQRSNSFIQRTAGTFYELRPDEPISLDLPVEEVVDLINRRMKLVACNSELAGFYGRPSEELIGTPLSELAGGCGLLEDSERIREFADSGFKALGIEAVRNDSRGRPVYLRNDAVGMVEDGCLVSIWGTQNDISRQKREKEEMEHHVEFYRRTLNALPGEVFVKDPRCRFLYVSHGVEARTGIPVDDWTEKTVFEVLPAAPRDFNKMSIQAMKSGKLCRTVDSRPGAKGEKNWIETLENPLISDDGVIEGVVGLSVDVTEQRSQERQLRGVCDELSTRLAEREAALTGTVEELERRKAELEAALDASKTELKQESAQRGKLDKLLKKTREEADAEREAFTSQSRQKVERLEEELRQQRVREKGLTMGCAKLNSTLSEVEEALRTRTQELESRSSEWDAKENKLTQTRQKLETSLEQKTRDLAKATDVRTQLESELDSHRKEIAASREEFQLQLEQETIPLKQELDELHVREEQLKTAQADAGRQLADLKSEFEARLEQQALDLAQAAEVRTQLENELDSHRKESAAAREEFQLQLEQQATRLKQELDELHAREEQLKAAQAEAGRQLAELKSELDERSGELESETAAREKEEQAFQNTRQKLEGLIQQEKEKVAKHLQQIKTDAAESRKAEQARARDHKALQAKIQKLETAAEKRTKQLAQAAEERARLEGELAVSRKEAAAGRETFRVQIDRQTKPLNKTLKELRARETKLTAAQAEADRQLAELKEAFGERTSELAAEAAARKKEKQEFKEARRKLDDAVVKEKTKLANYMKQFNEGQSKGKDTEKALKRKAADLLQENIKMELLIDQRTRKLAQAADQRVSLEARLADSQEEAARERETVEEQIEQKTQSLKKQLKTQLEKEEKLKEEQAGLTLELAGLDRTLGEQTTQMEELLKTKQELEKVILNEKENLAQHIELFKDEMGESRKAGQVWQQRESELLEKIETVEAQLEQRTQKVVQESAERKKAELELVRVNEVVGANQRIVEDFTEDLSEPLASVLQLSESVLTADGLSGEAHEQLTAVSRCARRLQSVLDYRLEIARLNGGAIRMQPEEFELNEFLAGLDSEFSEKADAGRIYFALSGARDLPGTVRADQEKIHQILRDLFDHALEHASGGRMGLHVVSEECGDDGSQLVFQLMYSGLDREAEKMSGLLQGQPCRNMSEKELHLDLTRRYAQLLDGGISLEHGSERNPLLRLVLPVEVIPVAEVVQDLPEACCA